MPGYKFSLKKIPLKMYATESEASVFYNVLQIISLHILKHFFSLQSLFMKFQKSCSSIIALSCCPSYLCVQRSTFLHIWTLTCNLYTQLLHKSGIDVPLLYSMLRLELKRAQTTSLAQAS